MIEKIKNEGRKFYNKLTGKESFIIDNLIEDKITINKNFISTFKNENTTAFEEILPIPPSKIYDFKRLKESFKPRDNSKKLNFEELINSLYNIIYENWNIEKTNLIFHSSGTDTRLISTLIRKVYLEKGGKVKFICLAPEIKYCPDIFKYIGWDLDENQIINFDILTDKNIFNFYTLWKSVNGVSGFPYNFIDYIIKNFVDDINNTTIWGGVFFNEAFECNGTIQDFLTRMYYQRHFTYLSSIQNKPEIIMPIFNIDSLKLIFESKFSDDNRMNLLKFIDPNLCNIPIIPITELHSYYKIPKNYFNSIINEFKKSFYYKNISSNITFESTFRKNETMWTKITLASFIEHLIEKNTSINY